MKHARNPISLGLLIVATSFMVHGQGTINFNNATSTYGSATPSHLITFGTSPWPGALVSSNYAGADLSGLRAQLYYGATTQNSISGLTALTDAPAYFRPSTSADVGSWNGGGIRTLQGFDVGQTVNAAVLVWDSHFYPNGAAAYNAFVANNWMGLFGFCNIFQYTVPPPGSPPSAYFMANQPAFSTVYIIPEPSALSFFGLAFALFLRKSCRGR